MNDTVIILCFFFVQGWAVDRQSGCAVQCTDCKKCSAGRLCAACIFRDWFYVFLMYTPEQNGSCYSLCNISHHNL